jgi:hypothetical protein
LSFYLLLASGLFVPADEITALLYCLGLCFSVSCALVFLLASPLLADPVDSASLLFSNLGPGNAFIVNRECDSPFTFLLTPFDSRHFG